MGLRCKALAGALAALLVLAAPSTARGPALPAAPPDYVVDLAGVIDDGRERAISAGLRELERATTAQVVVLTVPSLEGEALEAFSVDVAHQRWKLGQRGKDNGVLITLALQERRYRIEVGYGLEAVLPDSLVGSIGRELLVPAFRAGDYGSGLAAAAGEVSARIAAASGVALRGSPALPAASPRPRGRPSPLGIALLLLLAPLVLWLMVRHPEVLIYLLLSSRGGGSRGSWGGGGGGFGGGGGGFGGGGASGSW